MIKRNETPRAVGRGFTLIELLVVIAIIALLISILLPSLDAARRQAKQNACLSQMKNIASSSRVYEADDPSGWGIPVHPLQFQQCEGQELGTGLCSSPTFIGAYEWGGKSGVGRQDFTERYAGNILSSKYGTWAGFGPASRPLNEIFYTGGFVDYKQTNDRRGMQADTDAKLDIFKCPGDDGPPKGDGDGRGPHCEDWILSDDRSSYDHFGTSYAANIFMIASGASEMRTNSPYLRPTTRVPTPARTLYYEENIGRWAWSARREMGGDCAFVGNGVYPGPTGQMRGWHGKDWTYNRAFVDAHAEYQRIYLEGTEVDGFALHYRNERLSSYPDTLNGSPGTFDDNQCIIVRGEGWQKDTLPADLIRTGLNAPGSGRPSYENCVEGE